MVKFDQAPTAKDTILFEIETTVNGKWDNPPTIDRVVVYYIAIKPAGPRSFRHVGQSQETNLQFNDAEPVLVLGNRDMPAWKPGVETMVKQVMQDDKPLPGHFQFEWKDDSLREGNYVLFWQWRVDGSLQHAHKSFHIGVNKQPLTAYPGRYTPENKYKMLMDLYTPGMYKGKIKAVDLTPEVLKKLNDGVAEGFTLLEDLANQLIDMLDANLAHQSILPLLANFFGLKLRSEDTGRWRQQIKRAVQLYKRKGTLNGMYEALSQAGIRLVKLSKLWQVTSPYLQTDAFVVKEDGRLAPLVGKLSKLPVNKKFEKVRLRDTQGNFADVPHDCLMLVTATEPKETPSIIWQGSSQNTPVHLFPEDVLLITYQTQAVPSDRKTLEDYIQTLPLADGRHDHCETKNWNARLIEEDDPLFDRVIPNRHPFAPPTVYGKIRTTFLYSEQVYNMDTYNGSLRDSFVPCDLDTTFYDQCTACQSSHFNVDLEIESLSEERIQEAREIIREYSPHHAKLHHMNIAGAVNEFMLLPQEDIECLVQTGVPQQLTKVKQSESIGYEIEWRDGTKEKVKVN